MISLTVNKSVDYNKKYLSFVFFALIYVKRNDTKLKERRNPLETEISYPKDRIKKPLDIELCNPKPYEYEMRNTPYKN